MIDFEKELGRGGYGIVYADTVNRKICYKISDKSNSNRKWNNEFEIIMSAYEKIRFNGMYSQLKHVRLLIPTSFEQGPDTQCVMTMPRLERYDNADDFMVHPLFGNNDDGYDQRFEGRGQFVGFKQLEKILNKELIKDYCYEMGVLLGLCHFYCKFDLYDVEVYLCNDGLYFADFDLAGFCNSENDFFKKMNVYNESYFSRILWSMEAVDYFPKPNVNKELYKRFKKGYFSIFDQDNQELITTAEQLFKEYEDKNQI